jgi:hypothetical protein
VSKRIGRFEQADGGTLFLDEIAELPMALQAKLLRAIQEKTIERLGSNQQVTVDFRLITASALDLGALAASGKFRDESPLGWTDMILFRECLSPVAHARFGDRLRLAARSSRLGEQNSENFYPACASREERSTFSPELFRDVNGSKVNLWISVERFHANPETVCD